MSDVAKAATVLPDDEPHRVPEACAVIERRWLDHLGVRLRRQHPPAVQRLQPRDQVLSRRADRTGGIGPRVHDRRYENGRATPHTVPGGASRNLLELLQYIDRVMPSGSTIRFST